jgi:hypothetical protein
MREQSHGTNKEKREKTIVQNNPTRPGRNQKGCIEDYHHKQNNRLKNANI